MENKDVLEAIATISKYCISEKCGSCKIESICGVFSLPPCYWGNYIETIKERITKNETQNK